MLRTAEFEGLNYDKLCNGQVEKLPANKNRLRVKLQYYVGMLCFGSINTTLSKHTFDYNATNIVQ